MAVAADIMSGAMSRLTRFAWTLLAGNLAVILWGAYARATDSGSGCGGLWPLCSGEPMASPASVQALTEYGLALLGVLALWISTRRSRPAADPTRGAATAAAVLLLGEAALGAVWVLSGGATGDGPLARALFVTAHLVHSFLLLATLALAAHWSAGRPPLAAGSRRAQSWLWAAAPIVLLVVGTSGAVAALGDTLQPPGALSHGVEQSLSPAARLVLRLRLLHPLLAVATGIYLLMFGLRLRRTRRDPAIRNGARRLVLLVFAQILCGLANVGMLAPLWLRMVHLLLADLVWIATVLLTAGLLSSPLLRPDSRPGPSPPATDRVVKTFTK